jgi:hypothetical protein
MRILSAIHGSKRGAQSAQQAASLVAILSLLIFVSIGWAQQAVRSKLDARNAQGLTPLIVAASSGQADEVRSLLDQGASVDATAADGRTALIVATENNHIDVVQTLINAGANLNLSTRGGTALEVAERKGETRIAALLLASGAHSSGKSAGDTVCVRPWGGDGFCGTVKSFTVRSVEILVTRIEGCANGCPAKEKCSASRVVGGSNGVQVGDQIAVPSWCLTHTGVKP